ncbi:kinase-like domain-containing protein [Aspergillus filifer]
MLRKGTESSFYFWRTKGRRSYMTPSMWRSLGEGQAEVPIKEAELYKYQRYRWLSGETEELTVRYREFRLPALLEAATKVIGNNAVECIKILKCAEGQYNKAYILSMNNGQEIVAKLPNPNAGPAFYTTASEVATRQFVRESLGIPVPRIYAWSADKSNAVGAEYILEEKATGQPLGSLWSQMSFSARLDIVEQVLGIERKLTSVNLPQHGCIYYQSDLESRLEKPTFAPIHNKPNNLPNFAIGPLTHPKYWRGQRAVMNLDRGPWKSVADYAIAIGTNEIQWAKMHAQPRINYQRSQEEPETPDDYISLLQRYIGLAPNLVSDSSGIEHLNKLLHPDLHLDNIFINPQTNTITAIIDWQHISASPVCLLPIFPQMLEPLRTNQTECGMLENQLLQFYLRKLQYIDPLRSKLLTEPCHSVRVEPILQVPCCWDRKDLFSLRNSMINAVAQWHKIHDSDIKCPVSFTDNELEQHKSEMEIVKGISTIMQQLQDEGLIPLGGMVPPDQYEIAQKRNNYFKGEFIDLAEGEEQKKLHAKLWPYS